MWPIMEDLCNAPQCPDSYEMAKNRVYELLQVFYGIEEDAMLTMEQWSELVRDTLRKYKIEAESQ